MLGVRGWLRDASGGTAVTSSRFLDHRPLGPSPPKTRKGALISTGSGPATGLDLGKAQRHGKLFIEPDAEMYPGMIFGEHAKTGDMELNVSKKVTVNYQSVESMPPPTRLGFVPVTVAESVLLLLRLEAVLLLLLHFLL